MDADLGCAKAAPGATIPLRLTAKIEDGWHHLFADDAQGPTIPTTIDSGDDPAVDRHVYQPKPERKFDPNFNVECRDVSKKKLCFWIPATLKKDAAADRSELTAQVRYQACDRHAVPAAEDEDSVVHS